jgi:hypothetical protein
MARIFRGLIELFFDDGQLALGILLLLAVTAVAAKADAGWASMTLLVGGTLALLFENVLRAARKR